MYWLTFSQFIRISFFSQICLLFRKSREKSTGFTFYIFLDWCWLLVMSRCHFINEVHSCVTFGLLNLITFFCYLFSYSLWLFYLFYVIFHILGYVNIWYLSFQHALDCLFPHLFFTFLYIFPITNSHHILSCALLHRHKI